MPTKKRRTPSEPPYGELRRDWKRIVTEMLSSSLTAREFFGGYYELDEENPGEYIVQCFTGIGIESFAGKRKDSRSDLQSGPLDAVDESGCATRPTVPTPAAQVPITSLWSRLRDEAGNTLERLDVLQSLMQQFPEEVAAYVAAEIAREDLCDDWRNALVFLAEDVHFSPSVRQHVGERLLTIAATLRISTKVGTEKVVWSAMRRAATLLPPDPGRILLFLDRQGPVDTRSVALRCIERMFELAPPSDLEALKLVADRIAALAFKSLDSDIFESGEIAVVGQNAVCALAALGDLRLGEALEHVKSLGRRWMNRQLKLRLEQLLASWRSWGEVVQSHPAFRRIEEQILALA